MNFKKLIIYLYCCLYRQYPAISYAKRWTIKYLGKRTIAVLMLTPMLTLMCRRGLLALGIVSLIGLQSCRQLDNFMLGKDNTPVPKPLKPINSKLKLKQDKAFSLSVNANAMNTKLRPAIRANVIYVADARGEVSAWDKLTSRLIWTTKLNETIVSGPNVVANALIVTTERCHLLLLRRDDGKIIWKAKVSGEILAKPIIVQDKVITKTIDGNLYAFDLNSGKKRWLSQHGSPSVILKTSSSPIVFADKFILAGYSDGRIDLVDLNTGQLIWQRSIAYANGVSDVERLVDIGSDPIIKGDIAYLASYQGYVTALSLKNGQFLWRKPASVYKNMVVDDQNIYFTDSADVIWSINRTSGQINWKQTALKSRGLTEPSLMTKHILVGDSLGVLHLLAKSNGALLSREQLNAPITNSPSIDNPAIYVMTNNGKLNRFTVDVG